MSKYNSDGELLVSTSGGGGGTSAATITEGIDASVDIGTLLTNTNTVSMSTVSNETITTGGSSQQIRPANSSRRYFEITNNSAGDLWMEFSSTAEVDTGLKIPAGASWYTPPLACPRGTINLFGSTTGQKFSWIEAS